MPKFVIERQYLVPMYQHIVIEAENLEEACKKGISDDIDWDTQEMDSDSARATTITGAKLVPDGYNVSPERSLIIASGDPKGLPLDEWLFRQEFARRVDDFYPITRPRSQVHKRDLFTRAELERRIGLSTNVTTTSRAAFQKKLIEKVASDVDRVIRA